MQRYSVSRGLCATYRPTCPKTSHRAFDAKPPQVRRFTKRIRRVFRIDASLVGMQQERVEANATLTQRGLDRHHAQHVVVMVNGLNGAPTNWDMVKSLIGQDDVPLTTVFYASHANRRFKTFNGIVTCANRLSDEVNAFIRDCPNMKEISFMVHSMGGLIGRYACGRNYDPETGTVFGLKPLHFLSIASPHLGCGVDGESQVPFLGWGQSIPLVGPILLRPLISVAAPFVMTHIYRRTGQELFLQDGRFGEDPNQQPLLCRLVQDVPTEGYFLSALKAFQTRTCCANVRQDALVGWANASIRRISELPGAVNNPLSSSVSYRSDPLQNAFWGAELSSSLPFLERVNTIPRNKHEAVEFILERLQRLPWCRIDVYFQPSPIPILAHTHIQVTRPWIDSVGLPAIRFIVETFTQLESLVNSQAS